MESDDNIYTDPYVFSSSRLPGLTCARVLASGDGIFGADMTLAQLSGILARQKVAKNGMVWIQTPDNRLVASPHLNLEGASGKLRFPDATESSDPMIKNVALQLVKDDSDISRRFFLR